MEKLPYEIKLQILETLAATGQSYHPLVSASKSFHPIYTAYRDALDDAFIANALGAFLSAAYLAYAEDEAEDPRAWKFDLIRRITISGDGSYLIDWQMFEKLPVDDKRGAYGAHQKVIAIARNIYTAVANNLRRSGRDNEDAVRACIDIDEQQEFGEHLYLVMIYMFLHFPSPEFLSYRTTNRSERLTWQRFYIQFRRAVICQRRVGDVVEQDDLDEYRRMSSPYLHWQHLKDVIYGLAKAELSHVFSFFADPAPQRFGGDPNYVEENKGHAFWRNLDKAMLRPVDNLYRFVRFLAETGRISAEHFDVVVKSCAETEQYWYDVGNNPSYDSDY